MKKGRIASADLARLLRIHEVTVNKYFPMTKFGSSDGFMLVAKIDNYLAELLPGQGVTVAALRSGQVALMTRHEAAAALGLLPPSLSICAPRLRTFRIGNTNIYLSDSVIAEAQRCEQGQRYVGLRATLGHAFGANADNIYRLSKSGRLEIAEIHQRVGVTYESMLRLAADIVVNMAPADWLEEREQDHAPLVSLRDIRIDRKTAKRRLNMYRLPYVRLGPVGCRVTSEVAEIIRTDGGPVLADEEVAKALSVPENEVLQLAKQIGCEWHSDYRHCGRAVCWYAYIERNGSEQVNGRRWFKRTRGGERVFSIPDAAVALSEPELLIAYTVNFGQVPVFTLPNGDSRVLENDIAACLAEE